MTQPRCQRSAIRIGLRRSCTQVTRRTCSSSSRISLTVLTAEDMALRYLSSPSKPKAVLRLLEPTVISLEDTYAKPSISKVIQASALSMREECTILRWKMKNYSIWNSQRQKTYTIHSHNCSIQNVMEKSNKIFSLCGHFILTN